MSKEPGAIQVTVRPSLTTESDSDMRVRPSTLRFTTSKWNNRQTVTISANHDSDSEADNGAVTHAVTGADYEGTTAGQVAVTVDDDDVPSSEIRLTLASGHGTVREGGGTQEVEVTGELNASPRDTDTVVTLTLEKGSAQDEDFEAIEVKLTIIAGRTSATRQVPVTPVNDDIDEGAGETLQIATATTSGLALRPSAAFTITIEDDDEAGITLSQTRLTVEEGGSASYTISLNTQPTQATQVAISSQGDNRRDLRVTP